MLKTFWGWKYRDQWFKSHEAPIIFECTSDLLPAPKQKKDTRLTLTHLETKGFMVVIRFQLYNDKTKGEEPKTYRYIAGF